MSVVSDAVHAPERGWERTREGQAGQIQGASLPPVPPAPLPATPAVKAEGQSRGEEQQEKEEREPPQLEREVRAHSGIRNVGSRI